jgi:site-specific recombinase XerD
MVPLTTLLGVILSVGTGVRVGELVQIKTHDLDTDAKRITILGKGSRERMVYFSGEWVVDLVRTYLSKRGARNLGHNILLVARTDGPLSANAFRERLRRVAERAGIERRVTLRIVSTLYARKARKARVVGVWKRSVELSRYAVGGAMEIGGGRRGADDAGRMDAKHGHGRDGAGGGAW